MRETFLRTHDANCSYRNIQERHKPEVKAERREEKREEKEEEEEERQKVGKM